MHGRDSKDDRSLGELFSELAQETSTLVRKEVQLAKTEMSQKASRVGKDLGFLAAGGAVAYAGLLAIIAGLIVLVGQVIPMWLSALLVGLVIAGVGYILLRRGLKALKREDLALRQTIQTLKEDGQWAKDQRR